MGTSCSQIEPEHADSETYRFQQFSNETEDAGQPKRKRECTDRFFLYFLATVFVVLSGFLIYSATISDINRIVNGFDDCGNVCGERNPRQDGDDSSCVGLDMTKKPYWIFKDNENQCVDNCEKYGYYRIGHRCFPNAADSIPNHNKKARDEVSEDLALCSTEFIYITLISLVIIILMVILLRYFTAALVWTILISGTTAACFASIGLWVAASQAKKPEEKQIFTYLAIIVSVISIVIALILYALRKRISMVIQLFKEASKAIGAIPHILLQPLATTVAYIITLMFFLLFIAVLSSAGYLTKISEFKYDYVPNGAVIATAVLLCLLTWWMLYFYTGCQDMIVGGAIASWYFARDKSRLGSPILYSAYHTVRFHLGSVALGSFILMLLDVIRMLIAMLKRKLSQSKCWICLALLKCVFDIIHQFMQYFNKLAYIMTAMHGVPYCKGGKNAMRLLVNNGVKVLCLNSIGSFIFFLIKFIIVCITALIAIPLMDKPGLHSHLTPIIVSAIIASFMSHCFLSVYDTAIDTIFLCFCEDSEQNDGVERPYYMSRDLMLFVENSKKALAHLDKNAEHNQDENQGQRNQAWVHNGENNPTAPPPNYA